MPFPAMNGHKPYWGLLARRQCLAPTLCGWLVLLTVTTGVCIFAIRIAHPFLAINAPVFGGMLVVEGWGPEYAMEAAQQEFHRHRYEKLFVTGGVFETGSAFAGFKNHADLSAAVLRHLGMDSNLVQAVPAEHVRQDRTFASAVALRRWLEAHGPMPPKINVMSLDVHARRTRLLFEKALGDRVQVGIMAVENRDYDPRHWWRTSQGFRVVIDEAVAYFYARFVFTLPREPNV